MIFIKKPHKSMFMELENLLRASKFFNDLTEPSLKNLAEICIPKDIQKKQLLFSEGVEGHAVYLLISGSVQLFKTSPDGRETVIRMITPGELFGEVILFEQKTYPVSARALETGAVVLLPSFQLHCLLQGERFRNDFIRMLMAKQRYLTERIQFLTAYDTEERLFIFLSTHYGKKYEYTLPISKKDLAAGIGTLPETLSRLIGRLEKESKLTVEGNRIRVAQGYWDERARE